MNTSLEVEYWVVDADGDLVSADTLLERVDHAEPEFVEPMVEIKTTPCATTTALREELIERIRTVVEAAHDEGQRLVPLATPLFAAPADVPFREKESTELQRRIVGPAFDDARFCAGTHLHLEQSNVVDQLNTLTALDPAFALLSSAAHYNGERLVECVRPYLYRRCCYAGCPDQGQLWQYVDSVEEWDRRLETAFAAFRERALDRGVDADRFDEAFDPYDAVWTPVRLREQFPTVEWRSPDTGLPSQVLALAETVRSIVSRANEHGTVVLGEEPQSSDDRGARSDERPNRYRERPVASAGGDRGATGVAVDAQVQLPPFETVERITDRAMRDGISDPDVRRYLRHRGFDVGRYEPLTELVSESRISRDRARSYRLAAADRLEADLDQLLVHP